MLQKLTSRALISVWSKVPLGPPDAILGVVAQFNKDTNPKKVNLSVGAYRDNTGKPVVLGTVRKAQTIIFEKNLDNEYAQVDGLPGFVNASNKLAYGEELYKANVDRIAGCQVLSGTGAIRLGLEFCRRYLPEGTTLYIPNPTWANHQAISRDAHLQFKEYRYFDPVTKGVDFSGFLEDVNAMPEGSILLLHACAHNPTGCDLTNDQWRQLKSVVVKRRLLPFFDMAYQGFTSGDVNVDAFGFRLFAQDTQVLLGQSFAKNMGLYGQRCGNLSFLCGDAAEKERVSSQLKIIARAIWSSPPIHGARIADIILNTPELYQQWLVEVKDMALRIGKMRTSLTAALKKNGSPHDWSHIQKQIGMFAFTIVEKYHIYLLSSGRISIAGLNENNVEYVAEAFAAATKDSKI